MQTLKEHSLLACLSDCEEEVLTNVVRAMTCDDLKKLRRAIKKVREGRHLIVVIRCGCYPSRFFSEHVVDFLSSQGYKFDGANIRQRADPCVVLACALFINDDNTYVFSRVKNVSTIEWRSWYEEGSGEYYNEHIEWLSRGDEAILSEKGIDRWKVERSPTLFADLSAYAKEHGITLNLAAVADFPSTGPYRVHD